MMTVGRIYLITKSIIGKRGTNQGITGMEKLKKDL
jgi:hypothetical protein